MTCTMLAAKGLAVMVIAAMTIILLPPKPRSQRVAATVAFALATVTFGAGMAFSVTASRVGLVTFYDSTVSQVTQALSHGDRTTSPTPLSDPTISQVMQAASYGIEDSSRMCLSDPVLPEHTIAVLFRYDCPDCTATLSDLRAWANDTDARVVFVSSRMPGGRQLAEAAHVTEVPSVVCVNPSTGTLVWRVAYETVDESASLNKGNLDAILKIATNKHDV